MLNAKEKTANDEMVGVNRIYIYTYNINIISKYLTIHIFYLMGRAEGFLGIYLIAYSITVPKTGTVYSKL